MGSWERFLWAGTWLPSRDESSQFWQLIITDRGHAHAAIRPRSRGDRALIAWPSSCDRRTFINEASDSAIGDDRGAIGPRSRDDPATIARRSGHDRATIGPRSHDDRATIARQSWFFVKERQPFDEDQVSRLMLIR